LPENWKNDLATGEGEAGYQDISDGMDEIVGGDIRKNNLVVFKERSIHEFQYVGAPLIFYRVGTIQGKGLLAPNAEVSLGDDIFFISNDNFYIYPKMEIIGEKQVRDFFFQTLNPEAIDQVVCFLQESTNEIIIRYPSTGSTRPDMELRYNLEQNSFTKGIREMTAIGDFQSEAVTLFTELVGTIAEQSAFWDQKILSSNSPLTLIGDSDGYVYKAEIGTTADSDPIDGYLEILDRDFGDPTHIKRCQGVELEFEALSGSMEVYVGTRDNVNLGYAWYGPYAVDMLAQNPTAWFDHSAKFFGFRFKTKDGVAFTLKAWKPWLYATEATR
jgi:hypothetical protein